MSPLPALHDEPFGTYTGVTRLVADIFEASESSWEGCYRTLPITKQDAPSSFLGIPDRLEQRQAGHRRRRRRLRNKMWANRGTKRL